MLRFFCFGLAFPVPQLVVLFHFVFGVLFLRCCCGSWARTTGVVLLHFSMDHSGAMEEDKSSGSNRVQDTSTIPTEETERNLAEDSLSAVSQVDLQSNGTD